MATDSTERSTEDSTASGSFLSRQRNLWERKEEESDQAFEAWCIYRDLGLDRTLRATAKRLQKSFQLIHRWNVRFNWVERADAYDTRNQKIREIAQEKAVEQAVERVVERVATEAAEEYLLTTHKTLQETARIAYADIRKVVKWDEDGNVEYTPSHLLDDHTAAAIAEFTITYDRKGRKIPKVKMVNKLGALQLAGQHDNLWKPDGQSNTTTNNNYLIFLENIKQIGKKLETLEAEYNRVEQAAEQPESDTTTEQAPSAQSTEARDAEPT